MEKQELFQSITERGFKKAGEQLVGVVDGFPVMVTCPAKKSVKKWILSFKLDRAPDSDERKTLKAGLKAIASSVGVTKDTLMLTINSEAAVSVSDAVTPLDQIPALIRQHNFYPPSICVICKEGGSDACMMHQLSYMPVHQACAINQKSVVKQKAALNDGNYLTGIIGAIIGGLIGCIPSILTTLYMDTIYSLLYALIPLCAYYGYKLLRGKMNRAATIVTILVSLFSVYFIEIVLNSIWIQWEFADYGITYGEAFSYMISLLGEPDTLIDLTKDALMSFFFVALGVSIVWSRITRTNNAELKEVGNTLQTLTVLPGVTPLPLDVEEEEGIYPASDIPGNEDLPVG